MIDFILLSHFQPGSISEGSLEQRQQCTLKQDVLNLIIGLPLLAVQEVTADVNKVLNLLVSQLFVL